MAGNTFCSTGVLDGMFSGLYSTAGGNLRIAITSSSDVVPTLTGCSSNTCLAFASLTTAYFTIATSSSGRVCVITACSCDDVLKTGVAANCVIFESASSVRYATVVTTQTLTTGNKVNIGSWQIFLGQPTT